MTPCLVNTRTIDILSARLEQCPAESLVWVSLVHMHRSGNIMQSPASSLPKALAAIIPHDMRLYSVGRFKMSRQIYRGKCPFHTHATSESPSLIVSVAHETFACLICFRIGSFADFKQCIDTIIPPVPVKESLQVTHQGESKEAANCIFCLSSIRGHPVCAKCRVLIHSRETVQREEGGDAGMRAITLSDDGVNCRACDPVILAGYTDGA